MKKLHIASEAVVMGGFSEGSDLMDPTRRALSEGAHAIFDSVVDESPNVADIQANPDDFLSMIEGKTLVLHSLASIVTSAEFAEWRLHAQGLILLNPVEPRGIPKTVWGAIKVAFQRDNDEENPDFVPSFSQGPKELLRHKKVNARNPFLAAKFSTVESIIMAPDESFAGGLGYFEYDDDEFGFNKVYPSASDFIVDLGYDGALFEGKHMAPIYRPDATAAQLKNYLEVTS